MIPVSGSNTMVLVAKTTTSSQSWTHTRPKPIMKQELVAPNSNQSSSSHHQSSSSHHPAIQTQSSIRYEIRFFYIPTLYYSLCSLKHTHSDVNGSADFNALNVYALYIARL